jgi:hypothetical protein
MTPRRTQASASVAITPNTTINRRYVRDAPMGG